jgi:hypothetical protein
MAFHRTEVRGRGDRGHRGRPGLAVVLVLAASAAAVGAWADETGAAPVARSGWTLTAIEQSPETATESTIVEVPVSFTLRPAEAGRIGFRLRLSVMFAWNNVRFKDLDGEDIAASLRTLTVVPGAELVVPVGERWLLRPYAQLGGLEALGVDGHRWLASLGTRAGASWDLKSWRLQTGGRLEYTTILDEGGRRVDEVSFLELGAGFSWPLGVTVMGEPASAGIFVIPRLYINPAVLVGRDGLISDLDRHLELGASFEIAGRPELWFVKLPSWYGVGVRLAPGHRSLRSYLGFPF